MDCTCQYGYFEQMLFTSSGAALGGSPGTALVTAGLKENSRTHLQIIYIVQHQPALDVTQSVKYPLAFQRDSPVQRYFRLFLNLNIPGPLTNKLKYFRCWLTF